MGFFDNFQSDRDTFDDTHHASLTHEVLGGAVAYEAMKAYEDHRAANGNPDSHAKAKEIFAGFAGAAIDRLAETKGLDAWDSYKRKQALDRAQGSFEETVTVDQFSSDY